MYMRRPPKLVPSAWDGLVVLAVVLLAAGSLLALGRLSGGSGDGALTAVVIIDGREADRFSPSDLLTGTRTYTGGGITLEVCAALVGEAQILDALPPSDAAMGLRVSRSDCPTQDCVRTGVITRSGQSIVCLPARIIIRLEGGAAADGGDLDAIIG